MPPETWQEEVDDMTGTTASERGVELARRIDKFDRIQLESLYKDVGRLTLLNAGLQGKIDALERITDGLNELIAARDEMIESMVFNASKPSEGAI